MKQLIEIFSWQYEGEYEQYFFTVEDENRFIKDVLLYLNTVQIKKEFPWGNILSEFQQENRIEGYFLIGDIPHLRTTYYIDFSYSDGFSIDKRTVEYKREEIK